MRINAIIPARYDSSRLPGKPLAEIHGKPMILHVWEKACQASKVDEVWVATDDERIRSVVEAAGGNCVMTMPDHPSGTDRCMEAYIRSGMDADVVINIQGDEPLLDPVDIDRLAALMERDDVRIGTLVKAIDDPEELLDPNKVKAVLSLKSEVLFFSRSAVPYVRGKELKEWPKTKNHFCHIGMYAFRAFVLKEVALLAPSDLEKAEQLEQLRWLENGYRIHAAQTLNNSLGIDTQADLEAVRKLLEQSS